MPKNFKCSAHLLPAINASLMNSDKANDARADAQEGPSRDNDILHALEAVSPRLSAIEQRIEHTEERLDASAQVGLSKSPGQASTSTRNESWSQDTVVP